MINVLDKWEVGGASCSFGSTKRWPSTPIRPRLTLDISLFAKRINHYSSIISQFSSDTAESSVCNGQAKEGKIRPLSCVSGFGPDLHVVAGNLDADTVEARAPGSVIA